MTDYYRLLGVLPSASAEEIKVAYRFLALALHPDRFQKAQDKALAEARFKEVARAHDVLRDPGRRQAYDRQRTRPSEAILEPDTWQRVIREAMGELERLASDLLDDYGQAAREFLAPPRQRHRRRRK